MGSRKKSVWILLLNWRNAPDTIACLDSIMACVDSEISGVIICDNGSEDGSIEEFQNWQDNNKVSSKHFKYDRAGFIDLSKQANQGNGLPVYIIDNGNNLGFAAGNNIGLEYLKGYEDFDYVFLLNNDTLVQDRTVSALVEEFSNDPKLGLCGSKVVYEHTRNKVQAYGGATFNKWFGRAVNIGSMQDSATNENKEQVVSKLDYILGAAMMISKPCLMQVGNMEERYFLYYEEIDWAVRIKKANFSLGYAPKSVVYHKEGASIGSSFDKSNRSLLSTYYLTASKVRFSIKNYPFLLPTVIMFSLLQVIRASLKGEIKVAKIILLGLFLRKFPS